jgi:hypothetical protein
MPTTNVGVALRTVDQSVWIDQPPPSLYYHGRATTLEAFAPIAGDHLFPPGIKHPILVVFTDGEEHALPPFSDYSTLAQQVTTPPLFVHVWAPTERIYEHGRINPSYVPDPSSGRVLTQFARATHGKVLREGDLNGLLVSHRMIRMRPSSGLRATSKSRSGCVAVATQPYSAMDPGHL